MEIADLVLVNKADGDLKATATRTVADYAGALRLMRKRDGDPEGYPMAMPVSAMEEIGLDTAWNAMQELADYRKKTGFWSKRRAAQARGWFEDEVRLGLLSRLQGDPSAEAAMKTLAQRSATVHARLPLRQPKCWILCARKSEAGLDGLANTS